MRHCCQHYAGGMHSDPERSALEERTLADLVTALAGRLLADAPSSSTPRLEG